MGRALGVSTLEHQVTHDLQALNAPPLPLRRRNAVDGVRFGKRRSLYLDR